MGHYHLNYKSFGDKALLIEWPPKIEEDILYDIISFQKVLEDQLEDVVYEYLPAYQSLAIFFNPSLIKIHELKTKVKYLYSTASTEKVYQPLMWHLPVCYHDSFGIDLVHISNYTKLSVDKIIEFHSGTVYTIYFIGFLPGFIYLGGLVDALKTPRKASPRARVLKGSVAIAGNQTGIYPQENAGGWNIIGNSPVSFLDVTKHPPVFSSAGDKVKLIPIEPHKHEQISKEIDEGIYKLKVEPYL